MQMVNADKTIFDQVLVPHRVLEVVIVFILIIQITVQILIIITNSPGLHMVHMKIQQRLSVEKRTSPLDYLNFGQDLIQGRTIQAVPALINQILW